MRQPAGTVGRALRRRGAHWLGAWLLAAAMAQSPAQAAPKLHRYWPQFPRAAKLVMAEDPPSPEYGILLATLAGLTARPGPRTGPREVIWLPVEHPAYVRLLKDVVAHTGAKVEAPRKMWDLVERYRKAGLVRGYVLYRLDASDRAIHSDGPMDVSANVATSLCAPLGAVAVAEGLEAEARAHGLTRLEDARSLTEAAVLDRYDRSFSRRVLATIDPRVAAIRAEAVAMGAFVASHPGPIYERALARLEPDSPVLGWGAGDEALQTAPSSRWAAFQTATNWCANLPLLATETAGGTYPAERLRPASKRTLWDLTWEEDVHYASFLMSDGDNVQWAMGNFLEGEDSWWGSAARGTFPMGWTIPYADLAQLSPYTLARLYSTAKRTDDFTLLGGGYYYPEMFGADRKPGAYLLDHARRIGAYMQAGRIPTLMLNLQKWDGADARRAYSNYAAGIPSLDGIFAVQYYPYTAGAGHVIWVSRGSSAPMPVVSARYAIWAQTGRPAEAAPTVIAARLNAAPHTGTMTEARFSWVVAHSWSWFREPRAGDRPGSEEIDQAQTEDPSAARGLMPVRWCVSALDRHVRILTPTDFVRMMQLRVRTRETLTAALVGLGRHAARVRGKLPSVAFATSHALAEARRYLAAGEYRAAFQHGQEAYGLLRAAGLASPP